MQILFYPLKSKLNKQGLAPLNLRITVGPGDVAEISTGKKVDPKLWDSVKKKVSGKSAQADVLNKYISFVNNKINQIEIDLQLKDVSYNAEIIKNLFTGDAVKKYTLLQIVDFHNVDYESKIGQKGYSQTTYNKYINLRGKFVRFISEKYKRSDLFVSELNFDFIDSFWNFLITKGMDDNKRVSKGLDHETACVIIAKVKKLGKLAFRKAGIPINPFDEFKCSFDKPGKVPLTMDEVKIIMNKQFSTKRLDKIRDRFIVGCFTGMADADIQSVRHDMVTKDMQGNSWIDKGRTKTGELCLIPLWKPVLDIIEKYKDDKDVKEKNALFPQVSLQKMNEYLFEIAEICGIKKKLTTHIARHTFATFYLNSGGTLEGLARILGHSTTNSTRNYAKYEKTTIRREFNNVMKQVFKDEDDNLLKMAN